MRVRTRRLAGPVIVAAGLATLLSPGAEWAAMLTALLAGVTLWSLAEPTGGPLYADVAGRIASPRLRPAARAAVVLTAPLAGIGVAAYAAAALVLALRARSREGQPADWRTSMGTGFVGLAAVIAADAIGVTVGGEGALWCVLLLGSGLSLFWGVGARADAPLADGRLLTYLGVVLTLAGAGVLLDRTGAFGVDSATILGACAVLTVLAFVFVPRWWRTQRQLTAERRRREREQERAEIGEMLHDSVLQTLALIQRRDDAPPPIVALARRQERELRDWLLRGEAPAHESRTLDEGLRAVVAAIEDDHDVMIEAVIVGDAPLSPAVDALLAATREALLNAAKHGDGSSIALFAKVREQRATVFVRDRGPGFDPWPSIPNVAACAPRSWPASSASAGGLTSSPVPVRAAKSS